MTCLSSLRPAPAGGVPRASGAVPGVPSDSAAHGWPLVALGVLGALLLAVPGFRYRIDGTSCAAWPAPGLRIAYAATYTLALALLTWAWLGLVRQAERRDGPGLGRVLIYGAVINGAALLTPPFLSDDPLFYAAIGRVLAGSGGSAYEPLCQTLPAGDPFLAVLTPSWQCGTSAYFPGFHAFAWAIGKLAGSSLTLHLRLYQLLGASAMLLAAWVTGAALVAREPAAAAAVETQLGPARLRPAAAAALVAANPLAVIEGSVNGHNDALLALGCATFVYFFVRARRLPALACLLASLTVKASAGLLVGLYGLSQAFQALRRRWPQLARALPRAALCALPLALVLIGVLQFRVGGLNTFTALIGSPADPWDYCTRSVECLPRVLLRWILHRPTEAWKVGLMFRLIGLGFIARCAFRAGGRPLPAFATGLCIYYLYLHGWAQTWYLLPLLPLLPFATAATGPAMRTFCVSGCAYYGAFLVGGCVEENLDRGLVDLIEGLLTVVPPSVALWRYRNRTDV